MRAEFIKPGAARHEHPPEIQDDDYRFMRNKITGFPPEPVPVALPTLVQNIHDAIERLGKFEKLETMDITYVVMETEDLLPQRVNTVFVVNTYGACAITDRISPNERSAMRVRFIFNPKGELIVADNGL